MMLSKVITPKTKAELIRSLQQSQFRSFDVYEGREILKMQSAASLIRDGATVIVLRI